MRDASSELRCSSRRRKLRLRLVAVRTWFEYKDVGPMSDDVFCPCTVLSYGRPRSVRLSNRFNTKVH